MPIEIKIDLAQVNAKLPPRRVVAVQSVNDECHRVLLVDGAARGPERKALAGRKSVSSLDGDGVAGSGEEI